MAIKLTKDGYEKRLNLISKNWNFEILHYTGYKEPVEIKCLECGKIIKQTQAADLLRKVNPCCRKIFKDYHEKLAWLGKQFNFTILKDGPASEKKEIKCDKCGEISERSLVSILNTPWHCNNCDNYARNKYVITLEEAQKRLDEGFKNKEYTILKYQSFTKPALIKHNCGFCFKVYSIQSLFDGHKRGCPKCYANISRGEQKIMNWLLSKGIIFETQKTFPTLNNKRSRFDFYIPSYSLCIEYQGEQHFRDNNYFNNDFSSLQKRDQEKRDYCMSHGLQLLEIPYFDFNKIDVILSERFNDYLVRE